MMLILAVFIFWDGECPRSDMKARRATLQLTDAA